MSAVDFNALLIAALPKLGRFALGMTRNRAEAEDLVQTAAVKALAAKASFQLGTNFDAWVFRILRNEFISGVRTKSRRPTSCIDDLPHVVFSRPPTQGARDTEKDFMQRFRLLPVDQRQALVLANVEGMDYDAIASLTGVSVGTVKSRISRARSMMAGVL